MCVLPELRIKVIKILLMSIGIGIAVHLAEAVVNNAFADLDPIDQGTGNISSSANSKASTGALMQTRHRKRKHATTATGSSEEQLDRVNFEKEVPKGYTTFISVKIAALKALEALLTVVSKKLEPELLNSVPMLFWPWKCSFILGLFHWRISPL